MNKSDLAFGTLNYIMLGIGIVIIIGGFMLMAGDGTTEENFNPEIFSDMRIKIAPLTSLFGFLFVIAAILVKPRRKQTEEAETAKEQETAEAAK
jgi:membrane-bound ClpP family serine protease